ncbi:MAG: putative acyltransferase [Mucilaginibacter sp.]|nr:putative acyltransferase [Mucilaginibacter sp.]
MEFTPHIKFFNELTVTELYNILRLRSEVFVVEQNCVYQDIDNKDLKCYHLMLFKDNELAAYARLVPPGLSFNEMSIGRVVSNPKYRRTGAGRILMKLAIEKCQQVFAEGAIKIGAQTYLLNFYSSLGFVVASEPYDEDGIPHIDMIRKL